MNRHLLSDDVQNFIEKNLNADLHALLLKRSPFADVAMNEIAQQIKGRKVAAKKFPFLQKRGIVFPPNLNLEQASSQTTAEFKTQGLSGKRFVDLTCGFGIDAYFLSRNFEEVFLVEQNAQLAETVKHNWVNLNRQANFIVDNLEAFLAKNSVFFDLIYLDPARRDVNKNKKFLLEDLSPNLLEILPQLRQISAKIMVKLSPLIDISYLISIISDLERIQIIAVRNEVKELVLTILPNSTSSDVQIECVNLESADSVFSFKFNDEKSAAATYSEVQQYLCIPNSAVLKAGAFSLISSVFALNKLHPNSHLYTSDRLIESFPGRVLKVEQIEAKEIRKKEKFNIISKNHPLSPDQIKSKYKISDGGGQYLIFTQTNSGKVILKSFA